MTGKRGRPSPNDLVTVGQEAFELVKSEARLLAPERLTPGERAVWLQLVNDQPADTFGPVNIPMMILYCRHVAQGNALADIAQNLNQAGIYSRFDIDNLDKVLQMIDRETKAATLAARSLRITKLSSDESRTVGSKNAKHRAAARVAKPWDDV